MLRFGVRLSNEKKEGVASYTWEDLKQELKVHFYLKIVDYLVRQKAKRVNIDRINLQLCEEVHNLYVR